MWNGKHWAPDRSNARMRLAKELAPAIHHDVATCEDDAQRKRIRQHALQSESERGRRAMVALAKSELARVVAGQVADPCPD